MLSFMVHPCLLNMFMKNCYQVSMRSPFGDIQNVLNFFSFSNSCCASGCVLHILSYSYSVWCGYALYTLLWLHLSLALPLPSIQFILVILLLFCSQCFCMMLITVYIYVGVSEYFCCWRDHTSRIWETWPSQSYFVVFVSSLQFRVAFSHVSLIVLLYWYLVTFNSLFFLTSQIVYCLFCLACTWMLFFYFLQDDWTIV
jgi:hypothetical protein